MAEKHERFRSDYSGGGAWAPADWGMAHSPYTKRDSLYTGYTLARCTFLIDKLREEDGQLRLWKIGILESSPIFHGMERS